jgi:hypothetical protein
MTTDDPRQSPDDALLEALFAEARAARPVPSEALAARVLADALREQPRPAQRAAPARGGWLTALAALAEAVGGRAGLAALGGATAVGLTLGLLQPAGVAALSDGVFGPAVSAVELMPGIEGLVTEGLADG